MAYRKCSTPGDKYFVMKIQLLNDLHIEFEDLTLPPCDSDIVILAGDIHVKSGGIDWIQRNIPAHKPVLYVLGNHEYYGKSYPTHYQKLKKQIADINIHVLENDVFKYEDVTFHGCTLWTDFELFGNPRLTGHYCQQQMTDYKKIRLAPKYSKLRSLDTHIINRQSVSWLKESFEQTKSAKNIVITHHAPSKRSLPNHLWERLESAAYVSNLDSVVESLGADLWVHGHIHHSSDYTIGQTRIICNPRGYPDNFNESFDINLTVEI